MRKILLISFDDGSVHDGRMVELLNRYGLKGTFNLNSGLEDFVWYYEDRFPVRRQKLSTTLEQYRGHEIAGHTLTHPRLDSLTPPQLAREAGEDAAALKKLFSLEEIGFAVPFTVCNERENRIIRKFVRYIRLSAMSRDFSLPPDAYHIPIHALYHDADVRSALRSFAASTLPVSLFVLAGHSYELEALDHWTYFEELLAEIRSLGVETMTTMEFVREFYPQTK